MTYTPGGLRAITDHNFLSTYDVLKPHVDDKLIKSKGNHDLTGLVEAAGFMKQVDNSEYTHHEENYIMPKIKATNGGAGSAGAAVTFTVVDAADVSVSQANNPYSGTLTKYKMPVRVGDIIWIKPASGTIASSNLIQAIVYSITAPTAAGNGTFVAYPVVSGESIPAVTTADEIIIVGNAHGEGSNQPDAYVSGTTKVTNNTQIIKETYDITGTAKSEVVWFKIDGQDYWYLKGEKDTYRRFLNYRELSILTGKKITNTTLTDLANYGAAERPIKATEGLISFAQGGTVTNYNSAAGFTLTDFENQMFAMEKAKGSMENLLFCGSRLSVNIDNELGDRLVNGGISYGTFNFSQEKKISLQFTSLKIGETVFHKKTYKPFNDEQTLAADSFPFPWEGIIIPIDMRYDPMAKENIPSFSMNYLKGREMTVAPVDLFRTTENGADRTQVRYISEIGFQGYGANRFGYIKRAS